MAYWHLSKGEQGVLRRALRRTGKLISKGRDRGYLESTPQGFVVSDPVAASFAPKAKAARKGLSRRK